MRQLTLSILLIILIAFHCSCESKYKSEEETASTKILSVETRLKEQERKTAFLERRLHSLENKFIPSPSTPMDPINQESPIKRGISFQLDDGFFDDPYLGASEPEKIIVIYTDLGCNQCRLFLSTTFVDLREKFVDSSQIQIRLRDFPLRKSTLGNTLAMSAHCAGERGKYWEFLNAILGQQELVENMVIPLASKVSGINETAVSDCINSGKYMKEIEIDKAHGASLGVQGVPSTILGKKLDGRKYTGTLIRGNQPLGVILEELEFLK
ncbi:MAG TPA: thioredoxin domain-containing protein [Oligoflexia bacterium]|nr:thioredoxin domain-containing protein [Oligoflexia bacterium]HMP48449.1 thioredoxin domain-containing protein [Oligoflexia bacterium]